MLFGWRQTFARNSHRDVGPESVCWTISGDLKSIVSIERSQGGGNMLKAGSGIGRLSSGLSVNRYSIVNLSKWIFFIYVVIEHNPIKVVDFMLENNGRKPF